ncbi:MAG: CDP-alcohol phosphatidyltransferase family protein [Hyphomicrobiales bacterium]
MNKSVEPASLVDGQPKDNALGGETLVCIISADATAQQNTQSFWGRSTGERLRILFEREGARGFIEPGDLPAYKGPVVLVREDAVIDPPLIPVLVSQSEFALLSDDENEDAAIAVNATGKTAVAAAKAMQTSAPLPKSLKLDQRRPAELNTTFWTKLRKREVPYARIVTPENMAETEWRMFMGTYKGATDFITKYLWPKPAYYVTRWLAPTFVTPNMVTTLSAVCVLAAFWLFMEGYFITGLIAAWLMTFLDTVDGKLARTTLTSSKWGDIFDHGIDLLHPPFWYAAWAMGLVITGTWQWGGEFMAQVLTIIIGGYILQRLMEGAAIALLKLEIHIWRPIDTAFRLVTARRNPNLALLTLFTVLFARPDIALVSVAVWTFVCLLLHLIQLVHAFIVKSKSGPLTSWMSEPVKHAEER